MKIHKESCHHKDDNDTLPSDVRCRCICTCPTIPENARRLPCNCICIWCAEGINQDHNHCNWNCVSPKGESNISGDEIWDNATKEPILKAIAEFAMAGKAKCMRWCHCKENGRNLLCNCHCHQGDGWTKDIPISTGFYQVEDWVKCSHCEPENFGISTIEGCKCVCHKEKIGLGAIKGFIEDARKSLPDYIDQEYPKVEHSDKCFERNWNLKKWFGCTRDCPRKDYDGSRGRATVDIVNFLIWIEKKL